MINYKEPKEIIVYCDKYTGDCLVRLVDNKFNDIMVYGDLPALSSISDLIIKVVDVIEFEYEDNTCIINDDIVFEFNSSKNSINIYNNLNKCKNEDIKDISLYTRDLFSIVLPIMD